MFVHLGRGVYKKRKRKIVPKNRSKRAVTVPKKKEFEPVKIWLNDTVIIIFFIKWFNEKSTIYFLFYFLIIQFLIMIKLIISLY